MTNLLANPSFEDDTAWTFAGPAGIASGFAYEGSRYAYIGWTPAEGETPAVMGEVSQVFTVPPDGEGYHFLEGQSNSNNFLIDAVPQAYAFALHVLIDGYDITLALPAWSHIATYPSLDNPSWTSGLGGVHWHVAYHYVQSPNDSIGVWLRPGAHTLTIRAVVPPGTTPGEQQWFDSLNLFGFSGGVRDPLRDPTADWLRLGHVRGGSRLDQNSDQMRLFAGHAEHVRAPVPLVTATPALLAGKDPDTGLLSYFPFDLAALLIPPTDEEPGPTLAQQQCGVARRVASQLTVAYSWVTTQVQNALSAWLQENGHISSIVSTLGGSLGSFVFPVGPAEGGGTLSFSPVSLVNDIVGFWEASDYASAVAQMAPLTPGQCDEVAQAIYCALHGTPDLTVSGHITAIQTNLANYTHWIHNTQYFILNWCLAFLTDEWDTYAAQGAADPSSSCAGFDCGE